ncbi:GyrI-like domain-containing protein [Aureibacter tunicatorum]|uniref:GyrI-like small molecule binding domain-containing protein n=1 Tax=Aureibacter tunicatorum TaxID=866807 RepID=A0AAE3XPX5_9BACT|nr:GyrI-like domain-containing protein [Aureibacter tunicatorum]MDR6240412.1 hypothetical protein [Aureibacter tunicatorum]BDD05708.1 hypothetical protein AUTU_31910 [Aureibacter tunicatorum]
MKHEWRKAEKELYLPNQKPELINIPKFKFFTIEGCGNPNSESFAEYIGVLYSISYAVKMSVKKEIEPQGFFDYTVYPLEGIWDISEKAKEQNITKLNKDELVFKLMIRQPNFVDEEYAKFIIEETKRKKPHLLLEKVKYEQITDGVCIQMMHYGSYDNEPESFAKMELFAKTKGFNRKSKTHREIYLNDARKVAPEKLKTVLRFWVDKEKE